MNILLIIVVILLIGSIISSILLYKELQKNKERQKELHRKQIELMREITGSNDEKELETYVDLVDVNLQKLKNKIYNSVKKEN